MALTGCATVSVLPGTSSVETSVSAEQSALREAAVSFNDTAVSRGWISQQRGFFDLARILVDGKSESEVETKTYASLIGADVRASAEVTATLVTDANDAAAELAAVSREANRFLNNRTDEDTRTAREDLVSFERALVQAQQTRRAFMEAVKVAKLVDTPEMTVAYARFDGEIDRARQLADQFATEYSNRDTDVAVL